MNVVEQMKKFVEPKSVAIFGVSRRPNMYHILQNLLDYGYSGRIYPINPNATEILGVKTYSRIGDITGEIELAIINLPRSLVPGVVRECVEHGVQSIIIETQGFADAIDDRGRQLQREIDKLVRESHVRILGPNSLGTANAFTNFSSAYSKLNMIRMPVGIVCQTGTFFHRFAQSLFIGKGIDLGNACDIGFAESLEYYEQDDETKVVALHIEGVRGAKGFIAAAQHIVQKKPVIALKTGRSEHAAAAAQSHTASLVGKDEVWEAAMRQVGVIRAGDIDELNDLVRAFYLLPPMKGKKVAIISISGGLGIIGIDACHRFNLELAELSPITMKRINDLLPTWLNTGNPVDIWPAHMVVKQSLAKVLTTTIDAVLDDDGVDAAMLIWNLWQPQTYALVCQLLPKLAEAHPDKPLIGSFFGSNAEEGRSKLEASGRVAVFHTPNRAIRALGHLARYSAFRSGL